MINRLILLLIVLALGSACDENSTRPSDLNPTDTITYRVIGFNVVGSALIDYSTPTSGVITVTNSLTTPFSSGPIIGFNYTNHVSPSLNVTILQAGCVEAQILVNAIVSRRATGCAPQTISLVR